MIEIDLTRSRFEFHALKSREHRLARSFKIRVPGGVSCDPIEVSA